MIFKPDLAAKVADGTKTQTRRHKLRYETGKDYAVQPGRGKHAICRVRITDVRQERLLDISDGDVKAEGFDGREAFLDRWEQINHAPPGKYEQVYVYEFELVP